MKLSAKNCSENDLCSGSDAAGRAGMVWLEIYLYVNCVVHYGCCCTGIRQTGTFTAGHPLQIQTRMAFDGDMTLDATASDFELGEIEAYDTLDPSQTVVARMTDQRAANTLTLSEVFWNDTVTLTLTGPSSSTFDLNIVCESDAVSVHMHFCATHLISMLHSRLRLQHVHRLRPDRRSNNRPNQGPDCSTGDPTFDLTMDPTAAPSLGPTRTPTIDPTTNPTRPDRGFHCRIYNWPDCSFYQGSDV